MATHSLFGKISDITPAYIKGRYLVDLADRLVLQDGSPWPDLAYDHAIETGIVRFQEATQVNIIATPVVRDPYDFDIRDYNNFAYFSLNQRPVKEVTKFEVKWPSSDTYTEWPLAWVKLQPMSGQLRLVPTGGTIAQVLLGQGSQYLPLLAGNYSMVPQLFHISYIPGFPNDDIPKTIIDSICKMAVIELLTVASDTIYKPGVTSYSISKDGVSHSIGIMNNGRLPAVFGSRIGFYMRQLYGNVDSSAWDGTAGDLGYIRKTYRTMSMSTA